MSGSPEADWVPLARLGNVPLVHEGSESPRDIKSG